MNILSSRNEIFLKRKSLRRIPYIFLVPAILAHTVFFFYPLLRGFIYTFTDYNGVIQKVSFIGITNYIRAFQDDGILIDLKNTFIYTLLLYFFQTIISLPLAVLLSKKIKGTTFFRVVYYMPCIISTAAIGFIFSFIYNPIFGIINPVLQMLGVHNAKLNLLGDMNLSLVGVASVGVWASAGFQFIIYIAGLQAIPEIYYEAAEIDGAGIIAKFRYVTLPLLAPAITIVILLCTIYSLQEFNLIFTMTGGGPGRSSELISIFIYKRFMTGDYGYGSTVSFILFTIILIVSSIEMKMLYKREEVIR